MPPQPVEPLKPMRHVFRLTSMGQGGMKGGITETYAQNQIIYLWLDRGHLVNLGCKRGFYAAGGRQKAKHFGYLG